MNNITTALNTIEETIKDFQTKSNNYNMLSQEEKYKMSIQSQALLLAEAIYKDLPHLAGAVGEILRCLDNIDMKLGGR